MDSEVKSGKIAFRVGPGKVHMCNSNGIYYLDIETFMEDVITGVEKWTKDVKGQLYVQTNLDNMIKFLDHDPGRLIGNGTYIV